MGSFRKLGGALVFASLIASGMVTSTLHAEEATTAPTVRGYCQILLRAIEYFGADTETGAYLTELAKKVGCLPSDATQG